MQPIELTQINVYPIKSLGGIRLNQANLTDRGLELDRRWMLVNADGKFLTQRDHPELALLGVSVQESQLVVSHKQDRDQAISIPMNPLASKDIGSSIRVVIWQNICEATVYPAHVNQWFSNYLSQDCRLVFMPEGTHRPVDPDHSRPGDVVSFADGFPYLIIGESSLDELNSRLASPISMDRFRSNLVFRGGPAFTEDTWRRICIGSAEFQVAKPCPRCVMTTVDPETAETGVEPLRTLATYRRDETGGVMFGQNLLHAGQGTLQTGMKIEVLE